MMHCINIPLSLCGCGRRQRKQYLAKYLPWAIENGRTAKPLMPVFWEERWEQDIAELRKELQIRTLPM